jgi:hypothetical protein
MLDSRNKGMTGSQKSSTSLESFSIAAARPGRCRRASAFGPSNLSWPPSSEFDVASVELKIHEILNRLADERERA